MEKDGVSIEVLERFGEGKLHLGVIQGDVENGSLMSGQIAGLVGSIKPVHTIIEETVAEAESILARLGNGFQVHGSRFTVAGEGGGTVEP